MVTSAIFIGIAVGLDNRVRDKLVKGFYTPPREYVRMDWGRAEMLFLSDAEFRRIYRMSRASFNTLLQMIRPYLKKETTRLGEKVKPIIPELRLAITLRYLAGGNVNDLLRLYGVSLRSLYSCVWEAIDAINTVLGKVTDFSDPVTLQRLEQGFASKSSMQSIRGCIGAIDGLHIKIKAPQRRHGVDNPRSYYARKGFYSLNLQAV